MESFGEISTDEHYYVSRLSRSTQYRTKPTAHPRPRRQTPSPLPSKRNEKRKNDEQENFSKRQPTSATIKLNRRTRAKRANGRCSKIFRSRPSASNGKSWSLGKGKKMIMDSSARSRKQELSTVLQKPSSPWRLLN